MIEDNPKINGEPLEGEDFFNLLLQTNDFCNELGKVSLLAGKLEAELILYLGRNQVDKNIRMATLGRLIGIAEKHNLLTKNLHSALKLALLQRNYLTHNIYSLFINRIDETILPSSNIIDSDVYYYAEKVWELKEALTHLSDVVKKL